MDAWQTSKLQDSSKINQWQTKHSNEVLQAMVCCAFNGL